MGVLKSSWFRFESANFAMEVKIFSKLRIMKTTAFTTLDKIFKKKVVIEIATFCKAVKAEITAFVMADMIFAIKVMTAFIIMLIPFLREVMIAAMKFTKPVTIENTSLRVVVKTLRKNAFMEVATASITLFTLAINAVTAETILTKNVLMARMIARKPFFREVTIEVIKSTIERMIFWKKVIMEAKIASIAFFIEIMTFVTAERVLTKNVLIVRAIARRPFCREVAIAMVKFTKPVIMETTSFLVKDRIFTKKEAPEVRIVRIPVLTETMAFLIADVIFTKNVLMA